MRRLTLTILLLAPLLAGCSYADKLVDRIGGFQESFKELAGRVERMNETGADTAQEIDKLREGVGDVRAQSREVLITLARDNAALVAKIERNEPLTAEETRTLFGEASKGLATKTGIDAGKAAFAEYLSTGDGRKALGAALNEGKSGIEYLIWAALAFASYMGGSLVKGGIRYVQNGKGPPGGPTMYTAGMYNPPPRPEPSSAVETETG